MKWEFVGLNFILTCEKRSLPWENKKEQLVFIQVVLFYMYIRRSYIEELLDKLDKQLVLNVVT